MYLVFAKLKKSLWPLIPSNKLKVAPSQKRLGTTALGLYIKLFALYKNIFVMKVIKTEIRFKTGFQQPKTGFPKNPVLTSLVLIQWFPTFFGLAPLLVYWRVSGATKGQGKRREGLRVSIHSFIHSFWPFL